MSGEDLKLNGLRVVVFENRLAETLCHLVKLQGGEPFSAPAMQEIPLENNPDALKFAEKLFKSEIDVLILLTGVGTKALLSVLETRYSRDKILQALKKTTIVPRGPKPVRVLKELGVPFALTVPEPNTWREILTALDAAPKTVPLKARTVAIQEYGIPNPELKAGLEERGAKVLCVPVYRWALPDNLAPLRTAILGILEGKFHAVMFTTSVQAEHLFKVAAQMQVEDRLKKALGRMVVASVGPDCSETLKSKGLHVDLEPKSPKMGPLVTELAEQAAGILKKKQ